MSVVDFACTVVSKTLAPVHFILQTSADGVAALEAKIISQSEKYDYDKVYNHRKETTQKNQKIVLITTKIIVLGVKSSVVSEQKKDQIAEEILKLNEELSELDYPREFRKAQPA